MAKMWPRELPFDVLGNPFRNAEIKVFRKIGEELGDGIVAFYSRPWLGLKPNGEEIDGECDFVIADPESGVLVIEVKGGAIEYDPEHGSWTSTDRMGFRHKIKNPVDQARTSKHQLLDKLRKPPADFTRYINIRHCVIFPDSVKPREDLALDMPKEIVCFMEDFEHNFRGWVKKRLDFTSPDGRTAEPPGSEGIRALEKLLARPFHLKAPIGHILREDEKEIETLTQQQYHVISMIEGIQRAALGGSAGTGKTVLAIEQTARYSERGIRTLFVCFNRSLAEFVKQRTTGFRGLTVSSFHSWCFDMIKKAGLKTPEDTDARDLFEETVPELTLQALELLPEQRYDAIIVDEGQDFRPLWWPVLDSAFLEGGKGLLRVFFDNNQTVYGNKVSLPGEITAIPIKLSYNLRNTQRIHETAKIFYAGSEVRAIGPLGLPVEWVCVDNETQLWLKTLNYTREMISSEKMEPQQIAILTINEEGLRKLEEQNRKSNINLKTCRSEVSVESHVVLDTIRRFKGLERPMVILIAERHLIQEKELIYVGLTRARVRLVVIGEQAVLDSIKALHQGRI